MKQIPKQERPRERLINEGVETLSNEDLLSILLKTGTKEMSVKELSLALLKEVGSVEQLRFVNYPQLLKLPGIGESKACEILACIELAKRMHQKIQYIKGTVITNAELVFEYYQPKLKDEMQECFYVLYLDPKKEVISEKLLFKGTINYSLVHPREVFKEAYLVGATSMICVHNHPSGNVHPSKQDIEMTERLIQVGEWMGIALDDHVIIGKDLYYSFFENGNI